MRKRFLKIGKTFFLSSEIICDESCFGMRQSNGEVGDLLARADGNYRYRAEMLQSKPLRNAAIPQRRAGFAGGAMAVACRR